MKHGYKDGPVVMTHGCKEGTAVMTHECKDGPAVMMPGCKDAPPPPVMKNGSLGGEMQTPSAMRTAPCSCLSQS